MIYKPLMSKQITESFCEFHIFTIINWNDNHSGFLFFKKSFFYDEECVSEMNGLFMKKEAYLEKLESAIVPVLEDEGFDLVDATFFRSSQAWVGWISA